MAGRGAESAEEKLLAEAAEAWAVYLSVTHDVAGPVYDELEPWAWKELRRTLADVAERREALLEAARLA